jgi:hypothetical protein
MLEHLFPSFYTELSIRFHSRVNGLTGPCRRYREFPGPTDSSSIASIATSRSTSTYAASEERANFGWSPSPWRIITGSRRKN